MTTSLKPLKLDRQYIAILFVVGITLVALFIGRLIKDNIESQTFPVERGGVKANIAKGWLVQNGIEGESMLFTTSDPFDLTHRYSISQLPVVPNGQLTDSVVTRNFERAQELQNYQVLEQANVRVGSTDGFRVRYSFISTPKFSKIPVVMLGVDYYLPEHSRVVVVSMEDQSTHFDQAYPDFIRFLNGLAIPTGD